MKKFLALFLVVVMTASLSVAGTMAFLQDDASDVNVMTVGNVHIEQVEQERDADGKLVDFTQAKPAYPAVGPIEWDDEKLTVNGGEYKVFTDELKNVVDKIVTVNNVGKSEAYIRTVVAIEAPDYDPNDWIHINHNSDGVAMTWFKAQIDGVEYCIFVFTYEDALAAGAKSAPSLMQVFLDSKAGNEFCAQFGETWDILVASQAVQADGFANAETALDAAFGAVTAANHPWSNVGFDAPEADSNEVTLTQDLILFEEPLINTMNQDGFTFNGKGHTVIVQDVGGEIDDTGTIPMSGIVFSSKKDGNPVVVNDVTITGTMQMVTAGNYVKGKQERDDFNTTFNNVNIVDAELIYFSDRAFTSALTAYGTLTMNNCQVTGSVISAASSKDVPVYDMVAVNQTDVTINKSVIGSLRLDNQAWVTIYDSEIDVIDSYAITTGGLGKLVIGAGAKIGEINLYDTGKYPATITIEDGAEVGAIVYNGNTYTLTEWLNK